MELTVITLDAADAAQVSAADSAHLVDLLWTAAAHGERLEHISVQADPPGRLHLGLFIAATGAGSTRSTALAICRRGLAMSPLRGGWRIAAVPPLTDPLCPALPSMTQEEYP
ncbi:hypothetical protein [Streptomyces melanogenes]|uniref:hypothetical protein n=1 Tax=Streptomyces melanogenes TaxID=67326 RepID=UPI003797B3C1